jgi:hypothetical protein
VIDLPSRLDSLNPAMNEIEVSPPLAALDKPAAAADDLDDLGEISSPERKVVATPVDAQTQAKADRAERRRRFFAGEPDGLRARSGALQLRLVEKLYKQCVVSILSREIFLFSVLTYPIVVSGVTRATGAASFIGAS